MEFRVLGPLEVEGPDGPVRIDRGKSVALLQVLLLHPRAVVSTQRLIEALWGDDPPATAEHAIEVYASRLRVAFGADRIERRPPGYRLRLEERDSIDVERFLTLVADGAAALESGRPAETAKILEEADALWRGPALSELGSTMVGQAEISRLEEHRIAAREMWIESRLATGSAAELVPELERLVAEHPYRERLHGQLMLALYRSGRQADALLTYQRARGVLVDQLGVEPGSELQELQVAILRQDPALDGVRRGGGAGTTPRSEGPSVAPQPSARPTRRATPFLVASSLAGAIVVATVIGVLALRPSGQPGGSSSPSAPVATTLASGPSVPSDWSEQESQLLGVVPREVLPSCVRTPPGEQSPRALASLQCDLSFAAQADVVWYESFAAREALDTATDRALNRSLPAGDCDAARTDVKGLWGTGSTFEGVRACFVDDDAAWIVWTYEGLPAGDPQYILARATRRGNAARDITDLWDWWFEFAVLLR